MIRDPRPVGVAALAAALITVPSLAGSPPHAAITDCATRTIAQVQGQAHASPLAGHCVTIDRAVVTAVERSERGSTLWIQDPAGDANPVTSEALVVVLGGETSTPEVGEMVVVSGVVEERGRGRGLTKTTLVTTELAVQQRDHPLPDPVVLGVGGRRLPSGPVDDDGFTTFEPLSDVADFFESLEAMRVVVRDAIVVGPTSRFGELAVVADHLTTDTVTGTGGVLIQRGGPLPRRILIDDRLVAWPPMLRVGDRLPGDVAGVLDYSYGNYKLLNTQRLPAAGVGGTRMRSTHLLADEDHLTVATFNVENLSAVSDEAKFRQLGRIVARHLRTPDILALQEIQDDSGPEEDATVSARRTISRLVEAIVQAGGPRYEARQVDPVDGADGGTPGGNIRVAFLFNPSRVGFVDRPSGVESHGSPVAAGPFATANPIRLGLDGAAFGGDSDRGWEGGRKPLFGEFEFRGASLFVVNLHLRSKRGDDPPFGSIQPARRLSEPQRIAQADEVQAFVRELLARDRAAAVIVLGDLNDFEFRPAVRALAGTTLEILTERLPAQERYSYIYQGVSQALDHILVSPALASDAEVEVVHLNADFPVAERASDHDPVIARLRISSK